MRTPSLITLTLAIWGLATSPSSSGQTRLGGNRTSPNAGNFAQIAALHGSLPSSFDVYPADACSGSWAFSTASGDINFSVLRYHNVPFVHLQVPNGPDRNTAFQRLGPHTIKFAAGPVTTTVQCVGGGAMVDLATIKNGHETHEQVRARDGMPPDATPAVGRASGTKTPRDEPSDDPCKRELPRKQSRSLDGDFLYQQVCRGATTDMIVQIRLSDGSRRDVTPGNSLAVIRTGPWRGMLLVSIHKYKDDGSYDSTWVVRPDGKEMLQVPGTENGDDGQVRAWLKSNGWIAD